ncbi:mycothiol synthase [Streptomyces sp. NPDC002248]
MSSEANTPTGPAAPAPARRIDVLDVLDEEQATAVGELIAAGAREDGQYAVSEQGRLHLRGGERPGVRHVLLRLPDGTLAGYAQLDGSDPVESPAAELLVAPGLRARGHGRALGEELLRLTGRRLRIWAHGGHPAARHLARVLKLHLFRELRQLRRPLTDLDLPDPVWPEGIAVRAFVPGQDEEAWLELNAAAFAHHPEQGGMTPRDLADREAESWFDPEGFFLAVREDGGELVGFHWTKVHAAEELGEVYVVGVRPGAQGGGLGRALTTTGLRHLASRGLPTGMLYVDADNVPAVTVYERLGFTTYETDLMYRTEN